MTTTTYPPQTIAAREQTVSSGAAHRRSNAWSRKRILLGALPAAGITFGLFVAMNNMIAVPAGPVEAVVVAELQAITPKIADTNEPAKDRMPVQPIVSAAPPPQLSAVTIDKVEMFIPGGSQIGSAPVRIERTGSIMVDIGSVTIDRPIEPIMPPNVVYPQSLANRNIEGRCEVKFDVSVTGEAFNIMPVCTHSGFERSATRAVSKSRFAPKIIQGQPVIQKRVVYPIEYTLAED